MAITTIKNKNYSPVVLFIFLYIRQGDISYRLSHLLSLIFFLSFFFIFISLSSSLHSSPQDAGRWTWTASRTQPWGLGSRGQSDFGQPTLLYGRGTTPTATVQHHPRPQYPVPTSQITCVRFLLALFLFTVHQALLHPDCHPAMRLHDRPQALPGGDFSRRGR